MAEDWGRPVVHWELRAKDPAKQRDFYAAMFNWNIGDGAIMGIPAGVGGPDPGFLTGHIIPRDASAFVLYIQVRDLRASMERARNLAARSRGSRSMSLAARPSPASPTPKATP